MNIASKSAVVEDLAWEALAAARIVATAIREDVLHRLAPLERVGPKRLLRAIESREIFDHWTLDELAFLEARLVKHISDGTFMVDRAEVGEGNVSPAFWREPRLTEDADAMSSALSVVLELQMILEAIQDRIAAEAAMEKLRLNL
ncbi:hypothetical protein [Roseivivax sp. CAU 1753]